jgi:hypothetical protein
MGFKNVFNKAVEKATKLKDQVMKNEQVNKAIDKVVEHVTEERSTKEHIKEGAIDIGTAIALAPFLGLASIPAAAGYALVEGVVVKNFAKTDAAKKLAESRRNRKPADSKDIPKDSSKDDPKSGPKSGPKPQ